MEDVRAIVPFGFWFWSFVFYLFLFSLFFCPHSTSPRSPNREQWGPFSHWPVSTFPQNSGSAHKERAANRRELRGKIPANARRPVIYTETDPANQESSQRKDSDPSSQWDRGGTEFCGSAYNQHIIQGGSDIDPVFLGSSNSPPAALRLWTHLSLSSPSSSFELGWRIIHAQKCRRERWVPAGALHCSFFPLSLPTTTSTSRFGRK